MRHILVRKDDKMHFLQFSKYKGMKHERGIHITYLGLQASVVPMLKIIKRNHKTSKTSTFSKIESCFQIVDR